MMTAQIASAHVSRQAPLRPWELQASALTGTFCVKSLSMSKAKSEKSASPGVSFWKTFNDDDNDWKYVEPLMFRRSRGADLQMP
jgi:hypothetical protein